MRHHAAAAHHAAWVRHHGPRYWYSPWRPGVRVHWYHGVFIYGPPVVVVDGDGHSHVRREGEAPEAPKPQVERAGKFSLGVRGATYISDFYGEGRGYGDAGLGLAARYRIIDPLGIEAQWTYHDQSWSQDTSRIQQPLSVSAQLFAFPWTKVNPYVLAGVTVTDRNIDQSLAGGTFQTDEALWGPHGGLGLEFGLGKDVSLNFDARWIGYVNKEETDPAVPGAFQGNMGLNFYF
ncbi:MAG: outer membrane beta-barrel protein [Deltaproteobacteria bacterium]|nr:outer membrane beta-barrel protein [Deltaproteobacteria bacterium]